jgi:hypothetical protein
LQASLVVTAAVGASAETPLVWQNRGQMETWKTMYRFDGR